MVPPFMPRYSVVSACAGMENSATAKVRLDRPLRARCLIHFIVTTFLCAMG
ncbi:hypothetical protein ALQ62_200280 [Pseudomonas coronafaciens pv. zizaniae]|nr:hypothetical protein ALQ62_200280 [Pseudomonas coronafaciens pv. zizaniae]